MTHFLGPVPIGPSFKKKHDIWGIQTCLSEQKTYQG